MTRDFHDRLDELEKGTGADPVALWRSYLAGEITLEEYQSAINKPNIR